MNTFVTPRWESNAIGDRSSKELLGVGGIKKKKERLRNKFKDKRKSIESVRQSGKDVKTDYVKASGNNKSGTAKTKESNFQSERGKLGQIRKPEIQKSKIRDQVEKKTKKKLEKKRKTLLKLQANDSADNAEHSNVFTRNGTKLSQDNAYGAKKGKRKKAQNQQTVTKAQDQQTVTKAQNQQTVTEDESKNKFCTAVTKPSHLKYTTESEDADLQRNTAEETGVKQSTARKSDFKMQKLKEKFLKLQEVSSGGPLVAVGPKILTLRERMMEKLKASRFRYLNEHIYTNTGKEAQKFFESDPDSFRAYHDGYRQQLARWPLNPLDVIIAGVKKLPQAHVIADFGCGDARLARSVSHKVHSFDLIASNEHVTSCDMADVPLGNDSVDVAVFCLSLMGTNLKDYVAEANRVLKVGGVLKVVEVESRFDTVESFIEDVQHFGFAKITKDLSHDLFCFLDFRKLRNCKAKNKLPNVVLHPCLYKRR